MPSMLRVGRQTRNLAITLNMSASVILEVYHNFDRKSNVFSRLGPFQEGGVYIPPLK